MAKESKHIVKFKELHLKQNEKIVAWSDGYIGNLMGKGDDTQQNGVLLTTNERVVFYRKGIMGEVIEAIPLKNINSLERKSALMKHTISIHSSGNKIEFKSLNKDENERLVTAIEAQQVAINQDVKKPEVNQTESQDEDVFAKLKKLGELKELGVITDDEFNDKKSKLMERI